MTFALAAAAVLVVVGTLPSVLLTTGFLPTVLTAPLVASCLATASGVFTLIVGGPPGPVFVVAALLLNAASAAALHRRHGLGRALRGRLLTAGSAPVARLAMALALAVPFAVLVRPPVDWDAHSIWIYHAEWFEHGGSVARAAFDDYLTHPDYPPLLPATGGVVGSVVRADSLGSLGRTVQSTTALDGFAAVVWLVWLLADLLVATGRRRVLASSLAVLAGLVAYAEISVGFANAQPDFLCATAGAAAVIGLVTVRRPAHELAVPALLCAVAMLSKHEGFAFGVGLLVVAAWVQTTVPRWRWALLVLPSVAWLGVAKALGSKNILSADGSLSRALTFDADLGHRFSVASKGFWTELWPFVAMILVAAIVLLLLDRVDRRAAARIVGPLAGFAGFSAGTIFVTYLGAYDVDWWVGSSIDRVSLVSKLLLACAVAVLAAMALEPRSSGRRDDSRPGPHQHEVESVAD